MFCDVQTKTVNAPIALPKSNARPNAWGAAALPAAVMQAEPSQDSFNNTELLSQASGDTSSVISRAEEPARVGTAASVTTEDDSVPETPAVQSSTPSQVQSQSQANVQVGTI